MQRYFLNQVDSDATMIALPADVVHHFVTVMRAQLGEEAEFVLNQAQLVRGKLARIEGKEAWIEVVAHLPITSELPVKVVLACGVPKGEKAQLVVQKATELGVHRLIFFDAERSVSKWHRERRAKKLDKLTKIAQGAAEQSHRVVVPEIDYQERLMDVVADVHAQHQIVAWEESAKQGEQAHLAQVLHQLQPGETLLAVIGPEGGLTETEVGQLAGAGVVAAGLGPRILRTETAPLYLLAAVSYYFELEKSK